MDPVLPFAPDLPERGSRTAALHQQLHAAILDGRLRAGSALPSTRALATQLGIARNTVVAAYDLLVAEGYVRATRGARAVVAELRRPNTVETVPVDDVRLAPFWRTPFVTAPPRVLPERCFRLGIPDHRHFPHAIWRRLIARELRAFSRRPFSYPPSQGLPTLRAAVAGHVAFTRAVACSAEDVVVTSGAQQAFDLLARLLVTPGKTRVAVENPGYPPVRAAFAAAGADLVPIPVDDEGLVVDALPDDVRLVSVTPSHQSPTGAALSLRRRMALLDFARDNNALVIEDDYDGEFRFGHRPLDALQTLDREGRVFYVGTFSKTLFPALRMGFVVVPTWARTALVALKKTADSHSDAITQSVLAAFLREGHMARHVRHMRGHYAQRRVALQEGFDLLRDWLAPIPCEAGMHMAARLRDPAREAWFLARLHEHAPGAQSLREYTMTAPESPAVAPAVVFGYGTIDAADIRTRLRSLRDALGPCRRAG